MGEIKKKGIELPERGGRGLGANNDGNNGRDNGQWVYEPEIKEEGMEEWTKEEE